MEIAPSFLQGCLRSIECKNPYRTARLTSWHWTEEFMAKDLGEEDIVGLVFGFELVATDGAVGGAEAALVSRVGRGSRGGGSVLWELWA
jgi:hypothetical protein